MRRVVLVLLVCILLSVTATSVYADDTPNVLGGGICINEILYDPTGDIVYFDTDGDGIAEISDEFVEFYNLSTSPIDISNWEMWEDGLRHTFADGTVIPAGGYIVVVQAWDPGPVASGYVVADTATAMSNSGDTIYLYDPDTKEYIAAYYGTTTDDFASLSLYTGISEVGVDDFGIASDGISLTRIPSGDTNVEVHPATPSGYASPNAIRLGSVSATSPFISLAGIVILVGAVALLRRRKSVQ